MHLRNRIETPVACHFAILLVLDSFRSASRRGWALLYEMVRKDSNLGLASLCIGGGQGISLLVERVR
ncbi:MAG: hypothetical protein OEV28_07005 [Nitrospirota bacterium]|nr:hypothetical protein [Nitrospirota bacterium]